jgi:hypothetical protein
MALPPIISNLPIMKLFKSQNVANTQKTAESVKASATPDTVKLSAAAARQLKLSGTAEIKDSAQAQQTAANTRALLAENNVALGLDPQFS